MAEMCSLAAVFLSPLQGGSSGRTKLQRPACQEPRHTADVLGAQRAQSSSEGEAGLAAERDKV